MIDRTPLRRQKLWESCRDDAIDAFLIASVTNVSYLTGFTGDDSTFLVAGGKDLIISDGRYRTQLEQECGGLDAHIRPVGQTMIDGIVGLVQERGIRRLGFESAVVSVADHLELTGKLPGVELVPLNGKVEALRVIKDEGEIAAIREAIEQAERAFAMLRADLTRDMSEKDVTDLLESHMRKCGASSAAFPPIVAVGKHAALPHYHGSADTRLSEDDLLLVDWGATGRQYRSDLTRTIVTGKVTPKFEEVYQVVLAAQLRGIAAIRPGVLGKDVDAEARSVIVDAGFGAFFDHGLGHGLGMDIHEAPRLRRESEVRLEPGMIVTVEPGIYLPEWGGIRIEDDVLVTKDGHEVLTHVPKGLDSVRVG